MQHIRRLANLSVVLAVMIGCGRPSGPPSGVVSGKVTLDGTPLAQGLINFIPTDGKGTTAGGKIVNGSYSMDVPLGEKRVEIRSSKVIGQKDAYPGDPKSPKMDITEEVIPGRYNSQSELKSTVSKGRNSADFPLESPKK